MRSALLALAIPALLVAAGWAVADEPPTSILERLSEETAAVAERGERASAHLIADKVTWLGVLIGDPARFVMALDEATDVSAVPKQGRVLVPGQPPTDATLLDADADLGLALYSLAGTPRQGLTPCRPDALRRGALGVMADAWAPALVSLGMVRSAFDDVDVGGLAEGVTLLSPRGALLGLQPGHGTHGAQACTACHQVADSSGWNVGGQLYRNVLDASGKRFERVMDIRPVVLPGFAPYHGKTLDLAHAADSDATARTFVPGPVVGRALEDVALSGLLRRPYLGVVCDDNPGDMLRLTWFFAGTTAPNRPVGPRVVEDSAKLESVLPDSPAAKAGLVAGQEILSFAGVTVRGSRHFARLLARHRPGEQVLVEVKGWAEPVTITLGDRLTEGRYLATTGSVGLEVQALTAELAAWIGTVPAGTRAVAIRSVRPGSAAAAAGLQRGDVILDGADAPIRDEEELDAVLGAATGSVTLHVQRGGLRDAYVIELPARGVGIQAR